MPHLYTYKPLPPQCHTRVLELYPSQDRNAPVKGSLKDIDIYRNYDYHALSYTWGPPTFTHKIVLGENSDSVIMITPTLHDALVRFRDPHRVVRLWADALCINQKDTDEKARQIPMMAEIYRTASSVLIWLGNFKAEAASLQLVDSASRKLDLSGVDKAVYPHVQKVLALDWFTRRWIVQEAVLNTNVQIYCGQSASMSWQRLMDVVSVLIRSVGATGGLRVVQTMSILLEGHRARVQPGPLRGTGILDILTAFSSLNCFDPRDRIFALAGLASDVTILHGPRQGPLQSHSEDVVLQVDYNKTFEKVYMDFVISHLDSPARLKRIMQIVGQHSDGTHLNHTSSWAPDWRLPVARGQLSGGINLTGCKVRPGNTTGELCINFPLSGGGTPLQLPGYVKYSRVEGMSDVFPPNASDGGIASWVRNTWQASKIATGKLLRTSNLDQPQTAILLAQFERLITENVDRPWIQAGSSGWSDTFRSSPEFRRMVLGDSRGGVYVPSSSPDLFRAIRKIMTGRSLLFGSVICPGATATTTTAGATSPGSTLSKASSLFSRNKTPAPPQQLQNNTAPSAWPVMAIGPSHTKPGDVLCSPGKVEVQCLSSDPEGRSHSYFEHLGAASCILRPHTPSASGSHHLSPHSQHQQPPPSPPRTPSPSGRAGGDGAGAASRFLYIGETKSYRLCEAKHTGKWDPKVQQKAIAQHSQRLSSIVLC